MTTFNKKISSNTTNHEGADAYIMSPELELYSLVVTSSFSDKFYESSDDRLLRLRNLIKQVKPEFVAKLAIYAREEMYLRTIPLVLAVELAKVHNGNNLVSRLVERIIQRADELSEIVAYYCTANGLKTNSIRRVSKQLEKGIARAFNKFDEYQFAKYNRDTAIKLKDVLFKTHAKPATPEQTELFKKIAEDTLDTPYTWETELSQKGNNADTWDALIASKKLGYMATLRNLRNILTANVSGERIQEVANFISSPEAVRKSKQLPFRFLSAYRELQPLSSVHTSLILESLEKAILTSIEHVKGFDSTTSVAIACDVSGSMQVGVSPKSKVQNYDIGLMLGMCLQSKCSAVVSGMFGDTFKIINLPRTSILQNVLEYHRREGEVGYSTNGHLVLRELTRKGVHADKVMMFTDCQMYSSSNDDMKKAWATYKHDNPNAKLYLFDLAGYGDTPLSTHGNDVYLIAGWSDKVFDVLEAYENKSSALEKIKSIKI